MALSSRRVVRPQPINIPTGWLDTDQLVCCQWIDSFFEAGRNRRVFRLLRRSIELAVPRWRAYVTNRSVWKGKNMVRNAEHTRERILAEAEKLVMGQGFAGTSIDGILKAAELTK